MHDIEHTSERFVKDITVYRYSSVTKQREPEIRTVSCPDLMAPGSSGRKGSYDGSCYEQHHDIYLEQLREIFNTGIWY